MDAPSEAFAGRLRRWLRLATALLCGLFLLALTFVTVADVIGRYILLRPLPGAGEYTELLLMGIIFVGLPAVCLDDGHISVDVLTSRLAGAWDVVQTMAARLVVALLLAVIAWQLWAHGARLASYHEVTVYLRMPLGPFATAAAIIVAVCALATALMALLRLPKGSGGSF